jgi:SagB-type dehydrogenase family enzyme
MKKITVIFLMLVIGLAATAWAQGYDRLVREAEKKITAGQYQEALDLYEKAFKSGEFHYDDYINAARAHARLDNPDAAFDYLNRAVEAGYIDSESLEGDVDLRSLHGASRWQEVLDKLHEMTQVIESSFPEAHVEGEVIDLPTPRPKSAISVEEALKNRRSIRRYENTPMTLAEMSQLLWAAYGITMTRENMPAFLRGGLRTAPSAGALYPLELYVVVRNVTGIPAGVYWYKSEVHKLVRISEDDKWDALSEAAFHQPHFKTAAAAIVYSAVFERCTVKYGQRGRERYVCMDLGHSSENVYLQAQALKVGTCAIGAFNDLWLKQAIGMTEKEEPLLILPLGKVE